MENAKDLGPKNERVISLNQAFHPFDPTENNVPDNFFTENYNAFLDSATWFVLDFESIKLLGIAQLTHTPLSKNEFVSPFEPEAGRSFTGNDYNLKRRIEEKQLLSLNKSPDAKQTHNWLYVCLSNYDNENSTIYSSSEIKAKLLGLRLQVISGKGKFEAKPIDIGDETYFMDFYPQDGGPLPTDGSPDMREGLYNVMPNDSEQLATVEMEFVLAQDRRTT